MIIFRKNFKNECVDFEIKFFDNSFKHQYKPLDLWSESTKVIDYLKQVRMKSIEELRKAQDETLEYYSLNFLRFKSELSNETNIDEFRRLLFADKFYFQINFTHVYEASSKDRRKSVKINLEGLNSLRNLHLGANSVEVSFSIKNLNSLEFLSLMISCPIDENILTQVLDQVPHIKILFLRGNFSHFNLDHLFNLDVLSLVGTINESFNIDLFKNLCNQLTILKFKLTDK